MSLYVEPKEAWETLLGAYPEMSLTCNMYREDFILLQRVMTEKIEGVKVGSLNDNTFSFSVSSSEGVRWNMWLGAKYGVPGWVLARYESDRFTEHTFGYFETQFERLLEKRNEKTCL